MANEMITVNRKIFSRLEELLPKDNSTYPLLKKGEHAIRYIDSGESDSFAKDIIKTSKFENTIKTFDKSVIFVVSYFKIKFLIITGDCDCTIPFMKNINPFNDPDLITQNFKFNPGINCILFSNENFPRNVDMEKSYLLMDNVFSDDKEGIINGKFELQEISQFYSDFGIWEIAEDYTENINQNLLLAIFSNYVLSNEKGINLEFSKKTKENIKFLTEDSPIDLIGGNIYRALTSMEWKHSFLELYQCIEYLFPIPYIKDLSKNIGSSHLFTELYTRAENDLKWRPKEEEALNKLIKAIEDKSSFDDMLALLIRINGTGPNNEENNVGFVSKAIYQIRNSIAHFRNSKNKISYEDPEWDEIIEKLCLLIYDIYSLLSIEINQIKNI